MEDAKVLYLSPNSTLLTPVYFLILAFLVTWRCPFGALYYAKADPQKWNIEAAWWLTWLRKTSNQSWSYGWLSFHDWMWNHWPHTASLHGFNFIPAKPVIQNILDGFFTPVANVYTCIWRVFYFSLVLNLKRFFVFSYDAEGHSIKKPWGIKSILTFTKMLLGAESSAIERITELTERASMDFRTVHYVKN